MTFPDRGIGALAVPVTTWLNIHRLGPQMRADLSTGRRYLYGWTVSFGGGRAVAVATTETAPRRSR